MKAKKWLTIITLIITALSLVLAFIIGKNSNCITYDISMAIFGGAALGFIMSLTEYYVERRKAMEEFWLQATKVLNELKKIKYLDVDAPINLIVDAIHEDDSNALKEKFHLLSNDEKISVNAKENLISFIVIINSFIKRCIIHVTHHQQSRIHILIFNYNSLTIRTAGVTSYLFSHI